MAGIVLDGIENVVGRRENGGCRPYSHFLTMFSKCFFARMVKTRDCLVNGEIHFMCFFSTPALK